jgi:dCTP deaminase
VSPWQDLPALITASRSRDKTHPQIQLSACRQRANSRPEQPRPKITRIIACLAKETFHGILRFMFLSHQTIEKYIDQGKIIIEPDFDKKNIRPVGIRIHLAKNLLLPEANQTVSLTVAQELKYKEIDLTKEDFSLEPGQFVLGASYEAIQTPPNVLAILDGRSTVARLGLTTHITASVIDGTFETPHVAVLEIKNVGNFRIRLNFKDPIAMMLFAELKDPVTQKIQTQYGGGQSKVTPPNLRFRTGHDQ